MEFISDDDRAWTDVRTRRLTEIKAVCPNGPVY